MKLYIVKVTKLLKKHAQETLRQCDCGLTGGCPKCNPYHRGSRWIYDWEDWIWMEDEAKTKEKINKFLEL